MSAPFTRIKHRAWTYETAILDRLADGRTIGNVTYYSETSRGHQERVLVAAADVLVDGVPLGTDDLRAYFQSNLFDSARAGEPRGVAIGRDVLVARRR